MRVLLWGDYDQGNFGDDAMGVVFARALADWGHHVTVTCVRPALVEELGHVGHLPNPSDAVRGSFDAVVLGGGGALSRQPRHWPLRGTRRAAERRYRQLAELLAALRLPTYAVSIGGDGATNPAQLTSARRAVVTVPTLRGASLRLRDDLSLFDDLEVEVAHAPDVLYRLVADFTPVAEGDRGAGGVGLNLKRWEARRFRRVVAPLVDGADLVAVRTHTLDSGHDYESVAGVSRVLVPRTVAGFVADLAGLDLLVTSKLHVGLVALTLGIPVVCAAPAAKTVLEMRRLGLDNVARDAGELETLMRAWRAGERARFRLDRSTLAANHAGAGVHLRLLRRWLEHSSQSISPR